MSEVVQTNPPKRSLQFSLRALLIAMVIVAAIFGMMAVARQQRQIERLVGEVKRLRKEVGELTIEEGQEDRLHVIQIPTQEALVWKWRVYVPEGHNWSLHFQAGQIPAAGPVPATNYYNKGSLGLQPGQQTITLAVRRDPESDALKWYIYRGQGSSAAFEVSQEFQSPGRWWFQSGGVQEQTSAKEGEHVEVFRYVRRPYTPPQVISTSTTESGQGILLWIAPQS